MDYAIFATHAQGNKRADKKKKIPTYAQSNKLLNLESSPPPWILQAWNKCLKGSDG